MFEHERFVGIFEGFAILHAQVLLHDFERRFPIGLGVMNRFDDDADEPPDRILMSLDVSAPRH
jgi:hypothetical protein